MKKTDQVDGDDWLPDDVYNYCFDPDDGGYKANPPWDKLKYAPDQPLVAVFEVQKLGEPYYPDCPGDDPPHEREDLRNVVYDLDQAGFVHADMRFNHVLRAVNQGLFCPHHKCYHRWRLIDFDQSHCSVFTTEADEDREFAESQIEEVGAPHFWYGFP
ncbi:hypothetical protein ARMGADRAFT_1090370 [Armillaria gallica]|uniref:Uncharacterized protein n=1 Tax=Armillaria gallica TaxID=47427 RepID=A0A2H3D0F4_ARMGA|nr:hypothetical protein ARMGADRAFT_1090370 [Armillaria gallica]